MTRSQRRALKNAALVLGALWLVTGLLVSWWLYGDFASLRVNGSSAVMIEQADMRFRWALVITFPAPFAIYRIGAMIWAMMGGPRK